MSVHTLATISATLYACLCSFRLATPIEEKPWTPERKCGALLGLAANVFIIWLFVAVLT